MIPTVNIGEYLRLGGVYRDVEGTTPLEIYSNLSAVLNLPPSVSPRLFYDALAARELVLSTAVGHGVAIPHSQKPLLKDFGEHRIFICYLSQSIDMKAMDNKKVHTMIIPLTSNTQSHLHVISQLARLLSQEDFHKGLELRYGFNELYPLLRSF